MAEIYEHDSTRRGNNCVLRDLLFNEFTHFVHCAMI